MEKTPSRWRPSSQWTQISSSKYDISAPAEKRKDYVTKWQELVQSTPRLAPVG